MAGPFHGPEADDAPPRRVAADREPLVGAGHSRARTLRRVLPTPELGVVLGVAAVLNLWGLGINGWANTYYTAAVRSMAASWHNFVFASMDPAGLMTVDKPPLAVWVQALSARIFGLHPLSILVPQALMGVAATAFVYDLTRRRFGRVAGAVAGLALATTPIIVAVSRHNNPDELLVLASTAALWCTVRALEKGRLRWLVLASVCIGLGFETKMLVAFTIVPGIAAAWLWAAPVPLAVRLRRLLAAAVPGALVAAAWPILVTLTPAADRPWISGTSDNSVWSLVFGYNGLGRVAGQTGGPGGGAGGPGGGGGGGLGGTMFGGATGPLRLLQSGLGDQAGWLLGAALATAVLLVALTRLRRSDARTGWVIAAGGSLIVPAVVFSFAQGIFHPYYVSLLGPFIAALVGAGAGLALPRRLGGALDGPWLRIAAPVVLAGGAATELAVLGGLNGQLGWSKIAVAVAVLVAVALALAMRARMRAALVGVAFLALLAAPAAWAAETLGHATSSTFPAGGPASADAGPGGFGARAFARRFGGGRFAPPSGATGAPAGASAGGLPPPGGRFGGPGGGRGGLPGGGPGGGRGGLPGGAPRGGGGGMFGGDSTELESALAYARAHGGGTVAVESQSSAASAIVRSNANVAGLGGFSGRESTVSISWLAGEVKAGHVRFILTSGSGGPGFGGDTRTGSETAFTAAAKACRAVTLATSATSSATGGVATSAGTLYDCEGRAAALAALAG